MPISKFFQIANRLTEGLEKIHKELRCVHMDIKPENIFLDAQRNPFFGDLDGLFFFENDFEQIIPKHFTKEYLFPELLEKYILEKKLEMIVLEAKQLDQYALLWSLRKIWRSQQLETESSTDPRTCFQRLERWRGSASEDWEKVWKDCMSLFKLESVEYKDRGDDPEKNQTPLVPFE